MTVCHYYTIGAYTMAILDLFQNKAILDKLFVSIYYYLYSLGSLRPPSQK